MGKAKKDVFGDRIKKEPKEPKPAAKPPKPPASLLTDAQKKISKDMFAKYDLAKLTADQAKMILKVLETAGIRGPALNEAAVAGGMDADKFTALALGSKPAPPPPPKAN